MFEKIHIPILGIVENMATHVCPNCGHEEHIFGEGGGQRMARITVSSCWARSRSTSTSAAGRFGQPTVVSAPDSRPAQIYREIARRSA